MELDLDPTHRGAIIADLTHGKAILAELTHDIYPHNVVALADLYVIENWTIGLGGGVRSAETDVRTTGH